MRQEIFLVGQTFSGDDPADYSELVNAFENGGKVVHSFPVRYKYQDIVEAVVLEFEEDGKNIFHDAPMNGSRVLKVER